MGRLQNKNAIVTGGARGIGEGIVDLFVNEGACVVLADIDESAKAFEDRYGTDRLRFKRTDVTSEDDIAATVDFCVETFGSLDIMVNNAGALGDQSPILDMDAEGFERTTRLLMRSAALGHKYAGRQMKKQGGGSIVTTSSIAGIEAGWSAASYDAAKHITGQTLAVDGGLTSVTGFDIGGVIKRALEDFNKKKGRDETSGRFLRTNQ